MAMHPLEAANQLRVDSRIKVYATRDHSIKRSDYDTEADWHLALQRFGKYSDRDKSEVVLVPKGTMELVFRVDARERLDKGWSTKPPGGKVEIQKPDAKSFRLTQISGVGKATADKLADAGYGGVESWLAIDSADDVDVGGVGGKIRKLIFNYVHENYGDGVPDAPGLDLGEGDDGGEEDA